MQWYYADNQQQIGPVTEEDLGTLLQSGKITAETLVWHEGMGQWTAYGTIAGGAGGAEAGGGEGSRLRLSKPTEAPTERPHVGMCVECSQQFPMDQMIEYEGAYICAACKPKFFQRVQEGAVSPGLMIYGGFWIRVVAKFLDGLILFAINTVLSLVAAAAGFAAASAGSEAAAMTMQLALSLLQMAIGVGYDTFFLGKFGATPGKMACRLRVVRSSGEKITYARALGRYFAERLSGLTAGIGYLMAAFDDEKRTLHDRICDTRVMKTDA